MSGLEIVVAVVAKIAEDTVAFVVRPLARQVGYLFHYKTNVQNLRKQKEDLTDARDIIQQRVNDATNNCEQIHAHVERWLTSVNEMSVEANTFLNHEDHAKAVCSCRSFPHLLTRHQLSRKAKKMSIRVCELLEKKEFDVVAYRPQIESSFEMRDYETFDSRKGALKDIMVAVRDANRSRIGLCGMGGIGKTMLAKEIARQAQEDKLFSNVVLAPISQTPNLKEIQQYIADMLELKFGETDNSLGKRAKLLEQRLKPQNKILLILDDVWNKLDLQVIGIHNECKMLLTSRFQDVLRNYMGIGENDVFKIEALNTREARDLFKKIIGGMVELPDYKDLADQIVGKCAGLPICIATVAHALKCHVQLHRWKDALRQLQSSTFVGIEGMDEKVYRSIRLSYDFLESDKEAKLLLLLCALHKEDEEIEVENLMRYSIGYSFLQNINTMSQARDRVNSLVDKLKSHCLLLDGWRNGLVKMHDVIRDVCISIAKEDKNEMMNITKSTMYEKFVEDETSKESKAFSFLGFDDYDQLPEKLDYPSLVLLFMPDLSFKSIPDDFFGQTTKLQALQMGGEYRHTNGTYVELFPPSFSSLQNLQTLCLRRTYIEDITMIGKLKSLKVLDLSCSPSIKLLPKEIGQLRRLQLLDLRECNNLKVIEPNVISNLTQMEELYLPSQFMAWETKEGSMEERKNACVQEIKSLQQLTILYLSVQSINVLSKELFTEKLDTYRISIGSTYDDFFLDKLKTSRLLHLTLSKLDEINTFGLNSLIKRSEYLSIEGLEDITNVVHDLDEDGFPTLRYLRLRQLPLLEGICSHGNLPACSFNELRKVSLSNLTHLKLEWCKRIEYLFCFGMAESLVNLKELNVWHCESMKCILKGSKTEEDTPLPHNTTFFPKLEILRLTKLPALKALVSIGDDEGMIAFSNLKKLYVIGCDKFKCLLSYTMAQSLVQLEELDITGCENIEEVIASDEESGGSIPIIFEKLQTLRLNDLPNLVKFWEGDCIECPLLSKLDIWGCPKALEFISSNSMGKKEGPLSEEMGMVAASKQSFFKDKIIFPNLKELTVTKGVKFWREIGMVAVPEQRLFNDKVIFPNLQKLKTDLSGAAVEIFEMSSQSSSTISTFPSLSQLDVTCSSPNKSIGLSDVELFLHKNHHIHTLRLTGSSFVDGHQQRRPGDNELSNTSTSTSLMHLRISYADGLNHLFEVPSRSILFQNLKSLYIDCCRRLQSIAPSFMAFHKLESLRIWGCDRLTCLLATSTAASLPQLKQMRIRDCKGMRVVISDDEEQGQPEPLTQLVFHTLHTLTLQYLPNLKSFYSGDKVMSFPNLKELDLTDCPKMERFSHGLINTSASLNKIRVSYREEVEIREGDVNKTITKLWQDNSHSHSDSDLGLGHLFTQQKDDDDDDEEISSIVRTSS